MKRPYGHRSRAGDMPSSETILRRASKIELVLKELQPQIAEQLAKSPEAEWVFGRLFLLGLLNQPQLDAALRIDSVSRRYRSLLAPHGRVKGWRPESLRSSGEDL